MFEKFTEEARRAVVLAREESQQLQHTYIGTEHLLLGLLRGGDAGAAEILAGLNVGLDDVRRQVEEIIGRGTQGDEKAGVPFTPRAKKVLEMSLREAMELGHSSIDTDHLLLALLREGDGVAAQILLTYGAELLDVRRQVVERRGGPAIEREEPPAEEPAGPAVRFHRESAGPAESAQPTHSDPQVVERLDRIENVLYQVVDRLEAIERRLL